MRDARSDLLTLGDCVVDLVSGAVTAHDTAEERQDLTAIERRLLAYLATHADRAVSRDELLREVWGYRGNVVTRTVDVTVRRLRGKLEPDPSRPVHILTVHGLGYRFAGPITTAIAAPRAGAIPNPVSPLLGRQKDVDEVLAALDQSRLVTITGAAGVGKSRLAVAVARRLDGDVVFAGLDAATGAASAVSIVAEILGVPLSGATVRSAVDRVARALATRRDVVVFLDNAETIAPSLREDIARWLAITPARFVVTSRALLRVAGEHVHRLGPLSTDAAVRLFLDRRRAMHGHTDSDPAVAALVEALDGNPLAIELAAARAGVLTPKRLLARLDQRLTLLAATPAQMAHRHPSLRAAIEASWSLLDEVERAVAARCAVFQGGFDLDAVDAVLGRPCLEAVEALVDHSLVRAVDAPCPPGGLRMTMDESVRAYAAAQLGRRTDEARQAHARWYATIAHTQVARLRGPDARSALAILNLERDNLRAALDATTDPDVALTLGLALHALGSIRGPLHDRDADVARALEKGTSGDPLLRARLLVERVEPMRSLRDATVLHGELDQARALCAGHPEEQARVDLARSELAYRTGDLATAERLARDAAAALPPGERTDALVLVGRARHRAGDDDDARAWFEDALVEATRGEDLLGEARARLYAAYLDERAGRTAVAAERLVRACDRFREVGDVSGEAWALVCLGGVRLDLGDAAEAARLLERARHLAESVEDLYVAGTAHTNLGNLHLVTGDRAAAADAFRAAIRVLHQQGAEADEAVALANLGIVERDRGLIEQALARCRALGLTILEVLCLAWLAGLRAAEGEVEAGQALLAQARAHQTETTAGVIRAMEAAVLAARAEDDPDARAAARDRLPVDTHLTDVRIAVAWVRERFYGDSSD